VKYGANKTSRPFQDKNNFDLKFELLPQFLNKILPTSSNGHLKFMLSRSWDPIRFCLKE